MSDEGKGKGKGKGKDIYHRTIDLSGGGDQKPSEAELERIAAEVASETAKALDDGDVPLLISVSYSRSQRSWLARLLLPHSGDSIEILSSSITSSEQATDVLRILGYHYLLLLEQIPEQEV